MAARTIADVEADLVTARAARDKALNHSAYGQGDRTVTRAPLEILQRRVASLERELAQRQAAQAGANNPFVVTPSWS